MTALPDTPTLAMSLSRRGLLLRAPAAATAAAGSLAAAGCGLPGRRTAEEAAPAGKLRPGTTLTFTHFYGSDVIENVRQRIALFHRDVPGIQVDELQMAGGAAYRDKLVAMYAADAPPDVMQMSHAGGSGFSFGLFAPLGRFVELEPLARRDRYDLADFFKVALDFNSYAGKLYVMPNDLNVYATYWNQQLFRQSGLTPPPTDWRSGGFDHNALLDTARRLTQRGGDADRYGFPVVVAVEWLLPFLWSNGADVVSADLRRIMLDQPAALETLQFLADLVVKHKVAPTAAEAAAAGGVNQLLFRGRLGLHHTGAHFTNVLRVQAKDLAWDVAVSPRGRVRRATVSGGAGFAGAAPSKSREEAWALLKHLGSTASLAIAARAGQMPTRRTAARSEAFLDPTQPPPHRRVFIDAAENAGANPLVSNWGDVQAAIQKELAPLIAGERGVREAAAAAKQQGEALLAAGQTFVK